MQAENTTPAPDALNRLLQSTVTVKSILIAVLVPFSVLTGLALYHHGYWGVIKPHFEAFGPAQVLTDLVIALSMVLVWMWFDAKQHNRSFWPWLFLTLAAGSFGPLFYLLFRKPGQS